MCMRCGQFSQPLGEQRITPKLASRHGETLVQLQGEPRSLDGEGAEVKKLEQFVLDAHTYTEAETRMTQICEYEGIRPFEITQLTKRTWWR